MAVTASQIRFTIVGNGRLGRALARALSATGASVHGPLTRGERVSSSSADSGRVTHVVLLCVPEREIAAVADALPTGLVVAHCSASAPLDWLQREQPHHHNAHPD